MYSIYNTMSNYNFLEGQTPQLIEIDSTFTISHNANTVTFNANESHSLQSFVEKIKNIQKAKEIISNKVLLFDIDSKKTLENLKVFLEILFFLNV